MTTRFISIKMLSDILGVHARTVERMCRKGELKAVKVRSVWRIDKAAVEEQFGIQFSDDEN